MRKILFIILLVFSQQALFGQSADIQKLQHGDYQFVKGAVLVSLTDTVSPDFVKEQFRIMGYEVLRMEVFPVTVSFKDRISDERIAELSQDPEILSIEIEQSSFDTAGFNEMVERQSMDEKEEARARQLFESIAKDPLIHLLFKYHITKEEAMEYLSNNPDLPQRELFPIPKSLVVRTTPGQERQFMKKMDGLIYVTGTAFIGNQH